MSTVEQTPNDDLQADELTLLKQRATMMNITFSNNIGVEALRKKINDKLEGAEQVVEPTAVNPLSGNTVEEDSKPKSLFQQIRDEQMKLVRVRIQNLDPKKANLPGEVITVANEYMGTVRKFVPYGEATDNGYHIPYCIYNFLKERKFLNVRVTKSKNSRSPKIEQSWVREFSIELLPQLTQEELDQLAQAQLAAGSLNDD